MVSRSSSDNRNAGRGFVARGRTPPDCLSHRQAVDLYIPASAADCRSDAPDARAVKNAIRCSGGFGFRPISLLLRSRLGGHRNHTLALTA